MNIRKIIAIEPTTEPKPKMDYSNLFIGFEFEGITKSNYYSTRDKLKNLFNVPATGKTNGIITKTITHDDIQINIKENLYQKQNFITQIYDEHDNQLECVTRPINLSELELLKENVFKVLSNYLNFETPNSGLHITFLTNHHKTYSFFEKLVTQNIIQLSRIFYPYIIFLFGKQKRNYYTRKLTFRRFPTYGYMTELYTSKQNYPAILTRWDDNNLWGLEFRIPDGCNDFKMIEKQVRFYIALINFAWEVSFYGRLSFIQYLADENKGFYGLYSGYNYLKKSQFKDFIKEHEINEMIFKENLLLKVMKHKLEEYGLVITKNGKLELYKNHEKNEIKERVLELLFNNTKHTEILEQLVKQNYDINKIKNVFFELGLMTNTAINQHLTRLKKHKKV